MLGWLLLVHTITMYDKNNGSGMALFKWLILSMILMLTAVPMAWASNDVANLSQVVESEEFTKVRAVAIRMLQERGYQLHSIQLQAVQVQSQSQTPVFTIIASKNGVRYLIRLSYPALKIMQERRID